MRKYGDFLHHGSNKARNATGQTDAKKWTPNEKLTLLASPSGTTYFG
jgi:hypothetical protein